MHGDLLWRRENDAFRLPNIPSVLPMAHAPLKPNHFPTKYFLSPSIHRLIPTTATRDSLHDG